MEVIKEDLELQCWFFDKKYTIMYLVRGGTHCTRVLEFEICQRTAVRSQIYVRWHITDMSAIAPKDRRRHNVPVFALWRYWDAPHILCVPQPLMFAYYLRAFGGNVKTFGYLLLETATAEFTITSFVYLVQAVEYGAVNLFLPAFFLGVV